jgi:hypothetical protein
MNGYHDDDGGDSDDHYYCTVSVSIREGARLSQIVHLYSSLSHFPFINSLFFLETGFRYDPQAGIELLGSILVS